MAASVQFRPQSRDLGMVMREVDEDLAIFLGMRNGEKERNGHLLVEESHEFDHSKYPEPKPDSLLTLDASQLEIVPNEAHDNYLNLEIEKNDYNWFLTQPDSSLLPSLEVDVQDPAVNLAKTSDIDGISSKSELGEESSPLSNNSSIQQPPTPTNEDSSTAANRKPLSSSLSKKPTPRAVTPTGRSGLPAKSKPSRASTPTSRPTLLPSSKPSARSSTPSKPTSRSSTPSKTSVPAVISKSKPSSTTSTDKPSSSGRKTGPRNLAPSRGASPTVKSRPSKPSEMLSVSQDAPKVSMPKLRPASASRGRVSSTRSSSCNEKPRQRSCSPPKVRAPISRTGGKIILSRSTRGCSTNGDDVNPVAMGAKMVDRVVSMRKLAPPKQDDDYVSHDHNPKKSSSGFGRSLSKKSLDMAIRHMDIRRSITDKLRPIATGKSSAVGLSESRNFLSN